MALPLYAPTSLWPKVSAEIDVGVAGIGYSVTKTEEGGRIVRASLVLEGEGKEAARRLFEFATRLLLSADAKEQHRNAHGGYTWALPDPFILMARQIVARNMHDRDAMWCRNVLAGLRDDCPEMRIALDAIQVSHLPVDQEEAAPPEPGKGKWKPWRENTKARFGIARASDMHDFEMEYFQKDGEIVRFDDHDSAREAADRANGDV